ncbi:polysaccharide deacetylase family protein [Deinococcus altitudinis]|uniref:polysaccharide deacetylase family protein n=1 Tax=Deinococcus altitudinis TaxID=468914 RepID=UPI003892834E
MKTRSALGWGVLSGLLYIGLPYLLAQRLGLGLIREGRQQRRELALTFDDGPDPATTPAVLGALATAGARATFFVLLPLAEAHPELLRRILAEGHEVAPHAVKHRHAWIRSPWSAALEPVRAARRLAELTGRPARHYRPPHGAYTLATLLGMRWAGLVGVHWSVEGGDWQSDATPERTVKRFMARVHPGAVVVLHDAGVGARVTVPALPELLRRLREREYTVVRLSELQGAEPLTLRGLPRRLVGLLDDLYDRAVGNRRVGGRRDTMLRAGLVAFPLPTVQLRDDKTLALHARTVEFHVNNPLMVDIGVRQTLRQSRQDFRLLARDILADPEWRQAEAVFCISALRPLLESLGFESLPVPPAARRRLSLWATVLRRAYGTPVPTEPEPVLSVLSMQKFLERYGVLERSGA